MKKAGHMSMKSEAQLQRLTLEAQLHEIIMYTHRKDGVDDNFIPFFFLPIQKSKSNISSETRMSPKSCCITVDSCVCPIQIELIVFESLECKIRTPDISCW